MVPWPVQQCAGVGRGLSKRHEGGLRTTAAGRALVSHCGDPSPTRRWHNGGVVSGSCPLINPGRPAATHHQRHILLFRKIPVSTGGIGWIQISRDPEKAQLVQLYDQSQKSLRIMRFCTKREPDPLIFAQCCLAAKPSIPRKSLRQPM